jgi:hypothetical protein
MANVDAPRGFWPIRSLSGGEIRVSDYLIDSNTAGALAKGDVVEVEATGNIELSAADTGTNAIGIFNGCVYTDADGEVHYSDYIPATKTSFTKMTAYVYDDPNIVFGVQCDSGTAPAATDVGTTANHVAGTSDATRKLSGHELDSSQMAAQGGAQFKVLGLVKRPDNAWGEHCDVEVIFNEHHLKAAVAGI